jgi:uncharacterized membrane protein
VAETLQKLAFGITFAPLVVSLIVFPFLPETVPTHFGFGGDPDTWSSKWSAVTIVALFWLPVMSFFVYGFLWAVRDVPTSQDKMLRPSTHAIIRLSTAAFMLIVHVLIIGLILSNL